MASYYDFHGGDDDDVDLDFDESMPLCSRFQGIVFDKDGTLLDFAATWDPAIFAAIRKAAVGDLARQQAIADELGYDLRHRRCRPGAAAVHESNARLAARLDAHTYGQGRALVDAMADGACERAALAPRAGELLEYLREAGLPLAVATNDEERPTKRQLDTVWNSKLQLDFNVSICDRFDARLSAVLRELDESDRFVQKSAESTSI
jgi:phosphoglycolate phosphatase-like HAD superfamily hydrolase